MGENSKIEWTDRSINPIRARQVFVADDGVSELDAVGHYCEKISSGCANCYASRMQQRFQMPAFPGKPRQPSTHIVNRVGHVRIRGLDLFFDEGRLSEVKRRKKPTKFFWCNMTDLFGSWVPTGWIDRCVDAMWDTPQHTHQVLTKRPQRMAEYFQSRAVPPNVWLGTSVENQQAANERLPHLLRCPAAVRFVSAEPLLGPVDLNRYLWVADYMGDFDAPGCALPCRTERDALRFVIVGGESGPHARPMHPNWARSIRDQCQAAGVPFFFKQWGEWAPLEVCAEPAAAWKPCGVDETHSFADREPVFRIGKKAAGRLLDGREWNEFPQAVCQAANEVREVTQ